MNTSHAHFSSFAHLLHKIPYDRIRVRLLSYMTIQKLLIVAAIAIILLFDVFHIFTDPTSLAPVGLVGFEIGRYVTVLFLFFLLITDPPRAMMVRVALGIAAASVFSLAVYAFFSYQIGYIDSVLFTEVAIILGLEALEPKPVRQVTMSSHRYRKVTHVRVS